MEGRSEQIQWYKRQVLTHVRRSLIEEERKRYRLSIGDWCRILVEDVGLGEHDDVGDVVAVLFRMVERCDCLPMGPLYGFRMEAVEPFEACEIEGEPAHVVEELAEGWAGIILANLSEVVNTGSSSHGRDPERCVTWVR